MSSQRIFRFQVPDRGALDELVRAPMPDGWSATPPEWEFFRDIFLDASDQDLEQRGVTVRLRVLSDGRRLLLVDAPERETDDARVVRRRAEAEVEDAPLDEVLTGDSEPAKLLRGIIDPRRLEPRIELEIERRTSTADSPDGATRVDLIFDAVTLRHGELSTGFYSLELVLPGDKAADTGALTGYLETRGLRMTLASTLARARELLDQLELDSLERQVRRAREVSVVGYRDGTIGMLRDGDRLRLPTGQGWGEDACRRVMRAHYGQSQGALRLLGGSAATASRPALQVWLVDSPPTENAEVPIDWMPLNEVLDLVGGSEIRDGRTLAALHTLVRSSIPPDSALRLPATDEPRRTHPIRALRERRSDLPSSVPEPVRVPPSEEAEPAPEPSLLLNMELGMLAFNERVLALAEDRSVPLLDRVRFLSILGGNLDEFFMTRVAGFKQQIANGSEKRTLDGLRPEEQLDLICMRARQILTSAYRALDEDVLPELAEEGIRLLAWDELQEKERDYLRENYSTPLDAVLTPLASDPSHPFPHIRNLRPALAVIIRLPDQETEYFAAIELPGDLPRFVPLPGGRSFVALEELIRATLPEMYSGLEVVRSHAFRVTRSANLSLDETAISDMLQAVEEEVAKRPLGPVVRLEVEEEMPAEMRGLLLRELQFEARTEVSILGESDVYPVGGIVDLFALGQIASLPIEELHYPEVPTRAPLEAGRSVFEILRERQVLVRFPRDSFTNTVERLLSEAAGDPEVVSVKITLYRTDQTSSVVRLLREARRRGKNVVALVELKASFDERRNIEWARSLEAAGIHVVYGPPRLKVHAKIALVVRREAGELRRYYYVGTGNLNAATAEAYTDIGLLSTEPEMGAELNNVFDGLTGYSVQTDYKHLLVAPFNMRSRFLELIRRETEHAKAGRGGHIFIKINGLTDRGLIAALYEASQAGVQVDMLVRGLCSLRPGVEGVSDNIRIVSVLGRYLEHSRIYRFENDGEPEYFIGSADWRPRNLVRRVEVAAPIRDPEHRRELDELLREKFEKPDAWDLRSDGSYVRRSAPEQA